MKYSQIVFVLEYKKVLFLARSQRTNILTQVVILGGMAMTKSANLTPEQQRLTHIQYIAKEVKPDLGAK